MTRAATEYRYEKLTWPEINDAVELKKVCLVPCGAIEQHGPHLPLDVDGVMGAAHLATPEKGRKAYEEAVRQLVRFVSYFKERPVDQRVDHHTVTPTMPMPWGQRSV